MTDVDRYPLTWPQGWKRTPLGMRRRAAFKSTKLQYGEGGSSWRRSELLTLSDALERLYGELRRLGVHSEQFIISSNLRLRMDGLPIANQAQPADPGIAVYFRLNGKDRCLACDKWDRIPDNIAAIAGHIEALRTIDRYGVGTLDQAFAGYTQLQASAEDWWLVIGVPRTATLEQLEAAYREKVRAVHPDAVAPEHRAHAQGETAKLNAARDRARAELQRNTH